MNWYDKNEALQWVVVNQDGSIDFEEWLDYVPREYESFFVEVIMDTYRELYGERKPSQSEEFVTAVCRRLRRGPTTKHSAPMTSFYLH